jgi:uncharacterized protein YacL
MNLWAIRILFLVLCTIGGYAISQMQSDWISSGGLGMIIGFGFGWLMIAIDEMLKGFSLRAFSATTFGLFLGSIVAWLLDRSGLFQYVQSEAVRWLIRLCLFLAFGYIGIVLAMRSNKEDFSLIIPYVRFAPQNRPDNLLLLDTSVIIDGRIADLIEANFLEGVIVVPRFVLRELQLLADSADALRRGRGKRGLEILSRIQRNPRNEVKIHDGDFPDEKETDAKLVRLARNLKAKLFTNDHNLRQVAELQSVSTLSIHELARALKPVIIVGEVFTLKLVREGKDRGQAIGYLADGTMVVVNTANQFVGKQVTVQVVSVLHTNAGMMVFAELPQAASPAQPMNPGA